MDPLQLAYQPDICVDDAIIYFLPHLPGAPRVTLRSSSPFIPLIFHTKQQPVISENSASAVVGLIADGDNREYRGLFQDLLD